MPVEAKWTSRGVEWRLFGVVTLSDIELENSRFADDSRARRTRYQIIDLRDVERLDLAPSDPMMVGAFDRAQSRSTPGMRIALLAPDSRFDEALESYMGMLEGTSWRTRIFTDEAAARAWAAAEDDAR
jgi:hypothetical protein